MNVAQFLRAAFLIEQLQWLRLSLRVLATSLDVNIYFLYFYKQNKIRVFRKITHLPITLGSRSIYKALGTCFPCEVSLKNVLKESSPGPIISSRMKPSLSIWCSKQYNSQHAFPIWQPAWPMWIEIHSL